jgi:hypothetical protein
LSKKTKPLAEPQTQAHWGCAHYANTAFAFKTVQALQVGDGLRLGRHHRHTQSKHQYDQQDHNKKDWLMSLICAGGSESILQAAR